MLRKSLIDAQNGFQTGAIAVRISPRSGIKSSANSLNILNSPFVNYIFWLDKKYQLFQKPIMSPNILTTVSHKEFHMGAISVRQSPKSGRNSIIDSINITISPFLFFNQNWVVFYLFDHITIKKHIRFEIFGKFFIFF